MADFNAIAKQFTEFYYNTFDADRSGLANLYRDDSMLTWENTPIQGVSAIMEKLQGLPFAKVQHKVITLDAQPSSQSQASVVALVTGQLIVDDGNILQYSQMFHLVPTSEGSYFVQNDIFRLVYG